MMRTLLQSIGLAICVGASGCSFEAAGDGAAITSNTCSVDNRLHERCALRRHDVCCAQREIAHRHARVVPLQQPDGPQPVQFTIPRFEVENGRNNQQWELPKPIRVRGRVRKDGNVVNGRRTLTAPRHAAGFYPSRDGDDRRHADVQRLRLRGPRRGRWRLHRAGAAEGY